jgi:CTD small phosphatase-like protein 2
LDLDETLITSSLQPLSKVDHEIDIINGNETTHIYLSMRPYVKEFIKDISSFMEIVIFTASQKEYADKVLDLLDPGRIYIRHRLYRESCTIISGVYAKELSRMNRDLSKVIIVDNSLISLVTNIDNSILIKNYEGDPMDIGLIYLSHAIKSICKYDDLRVGICKVIDN